LRQLLLGRAFCADGARCGRCGLIEAHAPAGDERCQACDGALEAVELGEALVHRALLDDAVLLPLLDGADVSALLRF
jgi:hypothetical protein